MNGVGYVDQNGNRYISMKQAPICTQSCSMCKMNQVAAAHGKSIYGSRGMKCESLCEVYPDEVAEAFGYKKVDIELDLAEGVYTTDGYFFKELHKIPNVVNDMYVYRIYGKNYHKYLLSCAKYQIKFIVSHPLSRILDHLMPQHYECLVDTELEAIQIAKTVAMESVVDFAKSQVKTAMEALEEIDKESKRVLGANPKVDSIINNFWDNQVAISKSFRD